MPIESGSRLGPYEIASRIGAGGMGEVFRGKDTRIGRAVAVKVLPESLSSNADRLQRFEVESRAAGTLNHPNLVTIYDVGTHEGTPYIVMELIDGVTLRDKLRDGRLSPRTTIDYASQIAAGLAAAHEKGIVHRDLKPENIFVTDDDRVKILDFGLAKLTHSVDSNDTEARTEARNTDPGTVLGTVGYMSPEQVRGQNVDYRSDIFSFGAILYEMLTGKRPFAGDSTADTMSAILREDPAEISETTGVTPALDRIVRHCLEKNPSARFQSARDLVFDLQNVSNLSSAGGASTIAGRAPHRFSTPILIGAILIAAAIGGGATWFITHRGARSTNEPPRFTPVTLRIGNMMSARFSPDGNTVYYGAAYGTAASETFAARSDGSETHSLGIPNSDVMAVSSTGEVAVLLKKTFLRVPLGTGTLAIVSPGGGAPRPVAESVFRAAFAPDGKSLAVLRIVGGHSVLEYPIGHKIYEGNALEGPRISRDGESVLLFDVERSPGTPIIVDRNGHAERINAPQRSFAGFNWSAKGDEILCACGDDASTISAIDRKGHTRVVSHFPVNVLVHDVLPNGRILVEAAVGRNMMGIFHDGKDTDFSWLGTSTVAALTPDGKQVLFVEFPEYSPAGAFLRPLDGSPAVRLGDALPFAISPDGALVAGRAVDGPRLLLLPTGAGLQREINTGGIDPVRATFLTPKSLLLSGFDAKQQQQLVVIDVDSGARRVLPPPGFRPYFLRASPDGKRVLLAATTRAPSILSIDTGKIEPIAGLDAADAAYEWASDGKSLLVGKLGEFPATIDLFDPATRTRQRLATLTTGDPNGVFSIDTVASTPDGKTHVYSYLRVLTSTLYVIDGLR